MANNYEHSHKRQRTDDGRDAESRTKPPPSPCVHARGLSEQAIEGDLVEAVGHFGHVRDVMVMPRKRQAFIEFEDLQGAMACVEYCQRGNTIYCAGAPAFFNYSLSQKIMRNSGGEDHKPANHVLLFTILNPQYPITVDVMHRINSPYGNVQRIVIFKRNGVQCMVEFDNIESAKRARQNLNGADIYSGCCTLKIEFARPTQLNVVKNDNETWDFTNPNLPTGGGKEPLLEQPSYRSHAPAHVPAPYNGPGGASSSYGGHGHGGHGRNGPFGYDEPYDPYSRGGAGMYGSPKDHFGHHGTDRFGRPIREHSHGSQGAVCMVYGLNMDKINCDRLFNLFCLYGNVVRIKFLKSKEGAAMVQLGDPHSVDRAISNLSNVFFFGNKLQLSTSKQAFLQEVPKPHEIQDGTASYKDYMGDRNNRFTNPEAALKNRIQSPSKVLHFFNAPPSITEAEINEIFENAIGKTPIHMKKFPSKTERSCAGLIEFESKADGIEALVLANHTPIDVPGGKLPFIFKLCFSTMPLSSDRG